MISQEIVSFITVLVVAVCVASSISVLYASGLRLWARADGDAERDWRIITRLGSAVCFAACIAIVLFALWLMIPLFHN